MKMWQMVYRNPDSGPGFHDTLERFEVEGGWLYRNTRGPQAAPAVTMVFVPDPDSGAALQSHQSQKGDRVAPS